MKVKFSTSKDKPKPGKPNPKTGFIVKSSEVYFTIRLKVRRQETAKRPCGHLGQTAPL